MAPAGRPQLTRGVYSYEDNTLVSPSEALLDTSFVVQALVITQPGHLASQSYLTRLLANGTRIYFNSLLEAELCEAACQLALRAKHKNKWKGKRWDGRCRGRANRLMDETLAAWQEVLRLFEHVRIEPAEVWDSALVLMRDHGLASYDAIHAATAIYADVEGVITRDTSFAALPLSAYAVYTDSSRLASCRKRRPR